MAANKKLKRYSITDLRQVYEKNDIIDKINNIEKLEASVCRSKFKILIVNDNIAMANQIKRMVREETVFDNIFTTNCLEDANDLVHKLDISLILTGYRMGKGKDDCYDLYQHVIKDHPTISFCMVTGINAETEYRNLRQAGVPVLRGTLTAESLNSIIQIAYMKFLNGELEQCLQ